VLELCEGGSLERRLLAHKQKPGKWKPKLLVSTMLSYAKKICEGMHYLESQQCVHWDLAARNVLLKLKENEEARLILLY
jgi:serine/threonine protein kinase